MRLTRTLLAILAAAAVFTPTAVARLEEPMPAKARIAAQADLRSPDTRDAADSPLPVATPPTWPANPQPIHAAAPQSSGAGADDAALALGGLACVLAAGGLATFAVRERRRRHVTA